MTEAKVAHFACAPAHANAAFVALGSGVDDEYGTTTWNIAYVDASCCIHGFAVHVHEPLACWQRH